MMSISIKPLTLITLFWGFCSSSLFAQISFKRDSTIANYYFYQNQAELAIVDSNYTLALNHYKKAFSFKKPNPRELMNSTRLALFLNDTNAAISGLTSLALNGCITKVVENFLGEELIKIGGIYRGFEHTYDSLLNVFKLGTKPKLAVLIDSIIRRDQNVRQNPHTNEEQQLTDQLNIDSLIWFDKLYGFPDFQLLGFADIASGIGTGGVYRIIYWHARNKQIGLIDSIGLKAVYEGKYPPDEFIGVYDFRFYPRRYHVLLPQYAVMDRSKQQLPIDLINQYRAQIYLESIEDFEKKYLYMKKQGKNWFRFLLMPQTTFTMNSVR